MSLRQEQELQSGLAEFEQARAILENGFEDGLKHARWDRGLWFDWVFARVLLREASESLPARRDSAQGGAP